jgi:hypothetical protein
MAFLRHFDVKLVAEERPEMLLGGHATDHDPGALRYYYSDFLLLPEFMPPFQDTNPIVELDQIREYINMIQVCVCMRVRVRVRVRVCTCMPSTSNLDVPRHRLSVARALSEFVSVSVSSTVPLSLSPSLPLSLSASVPLSLPPSLPPPLLLSPLLSASLPCFLSLSPSRARSLSFPSSLPPSIPPPSSICPCSSPVSHEQDSTRTPYSSS